MELDNLDTICAAAMQWAYDNHEPDSSRLCVLLNRDAWEYSRHALRSSQLFDVGVGDNTQVFFWRGIYISWTPLIAARNAWVIGIMYS